MMDGFQNPWTVGGGGNPFLSDLVHEAMQKQATKRRGFCPQFNAQRSLFCMTKKNPIRRLCTFIVDSKPFEMFILFTILGNCIALALYVPYPLGDSNNLNNLLENKVEYLFMAVFSLECALKIIAYGFILHPDAYLRSPWNVMDFFIVALGLIVMIVQQYAGHETSGGSLDVKALRAFRVLRPLRLVSGLPSLQVVLNSIITAMVPLFHIALLVIFIIIVYAIMGLELFMGKLHTACYSKLTGQIAGDGKPCGENGLHNCSVYGPDYTCENDTVVTSYVPPNRGITSFDNILVAMLTVFQCITMEGWTTIMGYMNDVDGTTWVWSFFVSLIMLGSFFVLNLVLGVLSGEFSKEKQKIDKKALFKKDRELKRQEKDFLGYCEWLERAEEVSDDERECGLDTMNRNSNSHHHHPYHHEMEHDSSIMNEDKSTLKHCCPRLRRFRQIKKRVRHAVIAFVKSRECFILIIVLVFLNTVVLTTEYYDQPQWLNRFQEIANIVFVVLFTLEVLIKMGAFGFFVYISKTFNRFDVIVVILSIMEIFLVKFCEMSPVGVSVLRCARLLRIFKLTKYWNGLRSLVVKLMKSMRSIASLLVLMALFIMIFALLGMQVFGGKFNFETMDKPRSNFDSFWQALLTVFQILTGEDWNEVMYHGIESYGGIGNPKSFICLYFVILFICGNYILLNVFLAIAVDNLNDDDDEEGENEEEKNKEKENDEQIEKEKLENAEEVDQNETPNNDKLHVNFEETKPGKASKILGRTDTTYEELYRDVEDEPDVEGGGEVNHKEHACPRREDNENGIQENPSLLPPYSSFFIFSEVNRFRVFCHNVVCHFLFGNLVLLCILVSSIMLAAEDPMHNDSERNRILNYFDYFFTAIFTIEITLKMITYGFILHPGAFCRSMFNILDLLVVCVALISFVLQNEAISVVKILRVLRVLRPLRAINRAKGLKHVVQCVIVAVKSMGTIILVMFLLEYMFAVIGVQLFSGKFFSCTDESRKTNETCKGFFIEYNDFDLTKPELKERVWGRNSLNYDNVFAGMLSLFVVSTFEGWPGLLHKSIDASEVNKGPVYNYKPWMAIFYIIYIIIINFFMINIFVGFVIVTFQREGESDYKDCELSKNERKCIEYALKARPRRRFVPQGKMQVTIWSMVTSKRFEYAIFGLILLNTLCLACKYYQQPTGLTDFLDALNIVFTILFTVEFFLKLAAFGCKNYFSDFWNVLDFVIVLGSFADILLSKAGTSKIKFNITFFRLFRVMRLVKLISKEESIRKLLWTFIKSFQALPYVALLIVMLFFIYAVIGMQMFGKIALNNTDNEINRNTNFQSFGQALLVLFRSATGEAWQDIMISCSSDNAYCDAASDKASNTNCGNSFAYPYFISFYMICSFLLLQLFVAVIMDNFDYLTRDWSILGPHHLEEFVTAWAEYDREARGRVKHLDVINMLLKISPPLGFGSMCPHTRACHKLVRMNMPLQSDGTVLFNATLFALVRRNLNIKVPNNADPNDKSIDDLNEELRTIIKQIWKRTSPKLLDQVLPPRGSEVVTVGKFYATFLIQNWFRDWQRRKMMAKDSRYIPNIITSQMDRRMPPQPLLMNGPPRRVSSDLTGEEMKRNKKSKSGKPEEDTHHRRDHTLFGLRWDPLVRSRSSDRRHREAELRENAVLLVTNMNGSVPRAQELSPSSANSESDRTSATPSGIMPPPVTIITDNDETLLDNVSYAPSESSQPGNQRNVLARHYSSIVQPPSPSVLLTPPSLDSTAAALFSRRNKKMDELSYAELVGDDELERSEKTNEYGLGNSLDGVVPAAVSELATGVSDFVSGYGSAAANMAGRFFGGAKGGLRTWIGKASEMVVGAHEGMPQPQPGSSKTSSRSTSFIHAGDGNDAAAMPFRFMQSQVMALAGMVGGGGGGNLSRSQSEIQAPNLNVPPPPYTPPRKISTVKNNIANNTNSYSYFP